jgi:hypothetical protein
MRSTNLGRRPPAEEGRRQLFKADCRQPDGANRRQPVYLDRRRRSGKCSRPFAGASLANTRRRRDRIYRYA